MFELDFYEAVRLGVYERLGDKAEITLKNIDKINGVKRTSLIIRPNESNVAPSIYLDDYYKEFESGERCIDEVVSEVEVIYNKFKMEETIDIDYVNDYELAKEYLGIKIIDRERNRELLENVPYVPYLDLAIVFYLSYENEIMGKGSVMINNQIYEQWGVDIIKIYEDTLERIKENTPMEVNHVFSVLSAMHSFEGFDFDDLSKEIADSTPMFVMTNKERLFGATGLLYTQDLGEFADNMESDLYIIPCSIHELILIPTKATELDMLKDMVVEVNATQLEQTEVLSDSVYFFDRDSRLVSRVA